MPVPHNLFRTSDQEGEEYYGPIDGVRPSDHRDAYPMLGGLICCTTIWGPLYYNPWNLTKLCYSCYAQRITSAEQRQYSRMGWHTIGYIRLTNPFCCICGEILLKARQAEECTECIEEYMESGINIINARGVIDVITRW